MKEIIRWLLDGEQWVEYRTRVDLLEQFETEPEVIRVRKEMIIHPELQRLVEELKNCPGRVLSSHRSARQPFHNLSFVADLGLKKKILVLMRSSKRYSCARIYSSLLWKVAFCRKNLRKTVSILLP